MMLTGIGSLIVVTGLSGAGKSTAIRALEDLGYYCIDNLPPSLIDSAVQICVQAGLTQVALGLDARVGKFLDATVEALDRVHAEDGPVTLPRPTAESGEPVTPPRVEVLFLEASDESLMRRYNETRRPHPLGRSTPPGPGEAVVTDSALLDGIVRERNQLAPMRARATHIVDTTALSVHELRREITRRVGPGSAGRSSMQVRFVSFGFKYGLPVDADMVLDVRFLDNPHFVRELREHTGEHPAVKAFVLERDETQAFIARALSLLEFVVPRFEREGKAYAVVCVGCTGGRHRSVVLAEHLADRLSAVLSRQVELVHRDAMRAVGGRPQIRTFGV